MGSLSVLDKSVKEGKEMLERTDGLEVRGKGLGIASALISKFILHFLLTSSPSASYQGRMKVLLTSMNKMQIMMSLLKTLLFRSPESSFFRNVLVLDVHAFGGTS